MNMIIVSMRYEVHISRLVSRQILSFRLKISKWLLSSHWHFFNRDRSVQYFLYMHWHVNIVTGIQSWLHIVMSLWQLSKHKLSNKMKYTFLTIHPLLNPVYYRIKFEKLLPVMRAAFFRRDICVLKPDKKFLHPDWFKEKKNRSGHAWFITDTS